MDIQCYRRLPEEQLHMFLFTIVGGPVKWNLLLTIRSVWISFRLEEELGFIQVLSLDGLIQWCLSPAASTINLDVLFG